MAVGIGTIASRMRESWEAAFAELRKVFQQLAKVMGSSCLPALPSRKEADRPLPQRERILSHRRRVRRFTSGFV